MKIVDRYLLKTFWHAQLLILAVCYAILLIFEIFDSFGDLLQNNASFFAALFYYICVVPYQLLELLPLMVVLAMLFAIGALARNKEILALLSAGVSSWRIVAPLLLSGLGLALAMLALNEFVIVHMQKYADQLERVLVRGKAPRSHDLDVFRKGEGQRYYLVQEYNNQEQLMREVRIVELDEETHRIAGLTAARAARRAAYDGRLNLDEWTFDGATQRRFDSRGQLAGYRELRNERGEAQVAALLDPGIHQLLHLSRKPELLNIREGLIYLKNMRRIDEPAEEFETQVWLKIFFPFSCVVMILIGFAYALRAQNGRTLLAGFGLGVFYAILFYALTALLLACNSQGILPPWFAAVLPLVLFGFFGLAQVRRCVFIR